MTKFEDSPRVGQSFIERVIYAAPRFALVGGLALGATGCVAQQEGYSGGDTKRTVEAGTDVYDNTDGPGVVKTCGTTAEDVTALPIRQDVARGNALGNGEVQMYAFKIGGEDGLPLKDGHSCEGSVWVYKNQTTTAAAK